MKIGSLKKKIFYSVILIILIHISLFHYIRGNLILETSKNEFSQALLDLGLDKTMIQTQKDMDNLGRLAWYIVANMDKNPGDFYVHFLPKLDRLEKFHHLIHQPFTGITSCYSDIWVNSITCYGKTENSWGLTTTKATQADRLSILIMLIDRLRREMSGLKEHFSCYYEIFDGMPVHTLVGRTECYRGIFLLAKKNKPFYAWLTNMLQLRAQNFVSPVEENMWRILASNPKWKTIDNILIKKIKSADSFSLMQKKSIATKIIDNMPTGEK